MEKLQTKFHAIYMHCDKVTAKTMQSLGLISNHLTKESILMLYKTYISPHLDNCVPIWNPYLAKNIGKLECVQQRFNVLTI